MGYRNRYREALLLNPPSADTPEDRKESVKVRKARIGQFERDMARLTKLAASGKNQTLMSLIDFDDKQSPLALEAALTHLIQYFDNLRENNGLSKTDPQGALIDHVVTNSEKLVSILKRDPNTDIRPLLSRLSQGIKRVRKSSAGPRSLDPNHSSPRSSQINEAYRKYWFSVNVIV